MVVCIVIGLKNEVWNVVKKKSVKKDISNKAVVVLLVAFIAVLLVAFGVYMVYLSGDGIEPKEYSENSNGKVTLEIINPEDLSGEDIVDTSGSAEGKVSLEIIDKK